MTTPDLVGIEARANRPEVEAIEHFAFRERLDGNCSARLLEMVESIAAYARSQEARAEKAEARYDAEVREKSRIMDRCGELNGALQQAEVQRDAAIARAESAE